MPFVERNADGTVKGCYMNRQPGYAEEWLSPGDPDILAFTAPRPKPIQKALTLEERVAAIESILGLGP